MVSFCIEFAKKRIEDIEKEKVELQKDIKDIFQDFEDDVDFIKKINYAWVKGKQINETNFDLCVEIHLNDDVEDINYFGLLPYYTPFANENIWKNLSIIAERVKSYGLECFINYTVSKKINLKSAKIKVFSPTGAVVSKAIMKIGKGNKISLNLPKSSKPGKYILQVKAKNGKTYKALIIINKK